MDDTKVFAGRFCFNPLPARRPGATQNHNSMHHLSLVSILSQPEGRELRLEHNLLYLDMSFQSSPSPKAGSYSSSNSISLINPSFNPLPARRPGATETLGAAILQ